jgi:UDP-N-acetylmuramyl tripeptide synthase
MNKMKLKYLGDILGINFPNDIEITHATNSTEKIRKNSIFFGLQGTKVHGSKFIEEALELGASVAVHDNPNFKINNKDLENKIFYIENIDKPWRASEDNEKYRIGIVSERLAKLNIFADEELIADFHSYAYNKLLIFLCELYREYKFVSSLCHKYEIPNFYGFTGTNGKTTSAYMASQLQESFDKFDANKVSIYIGTLGFSYGYNNMVNGDYSHRNFDSSISKNTTPDLFEIFEILEKIANKSDIFDYINPANITINIEVSSHALSQGRLKYIPFSKAALMNIGSDHIDYHKSIDEYEKCKFKIFDLVHNQGEKYIGIDNINKNSDVFKKYYANHETLQNVSFVNNNADIYCHINKPVNNDKKNLFTLSDQISHPGHKDYICNIYPEFNIHNLVFSIIMSCNPTTISVRDFYSPEIELSEVLFHEYREYPEYDPNIHPPIILTNRVSLPPGRTQIISKIPANVIIDYAHNAEGFDFFLSSINDSYKKLIIIFGCGGNRDKEKRPKMLAAAIKYGAKVIFTTDNPRNEQFKDIFNDASIGNDIKDVLIIEDRKEAIIHGSRLIEDDDCLVILGKGHEDTQEINGEINYFSDYEVVNEIYK